MLSMRAASARLPALLPGAADQHFLEPRGGGRQIFIRPGSLSLGCARCSSMKPRSRDLISPRTSTAARSIAFFNSRTFPGHAWRMSRRQLGRKLLLAAGSREKILGEGNDVGDALAQRRQCIGTTSGDRTGLPGMPRWHALL